MAEPSPQRVEDLFNRAVDLEPPERTAFLDEQCGDDTDLRAAVEELLLLDSQAEADESLLRSALAGTRHREGPAQPAAPVQSIGRYRVLRVLGDSADAQVFESTDGVGIGDPVEQTGLLMSVRLGPGLLGQVYDGLQNPLEALAVGHGVFLPRGGAGA